MRQRYVFVLVLGLAILAAPAYAGNGPIPPSVGAKGPVSLPVYGDAQSMFRMPSSIGWSVDDRVDLDLFVFISEAVMRNGLNTFQKTGSTIGGSFGAVLAPGRPEDEFDTYAGKITLGAGIYPDMAGGGDRTKVRLTTFPETVNVRKGILFVNATFCAAYTPTEWLSVGLGLHLIYSSLTIRTLVGGNSTPLDGSPQINDMNFPGNPTYADLLALFKSDGATDPTTLFKTKLNSFQFGATLSLSLRPTDWFGFGISYRPRSWDPLHFEGEGRVDASRTMGLLGPTTLPLLLATLPNGGNEFARQDYEGEYDVDLTGIYVPRQVRVSFAIWPTDRILVGAEVAWIEFHRSFNVTKVQLTKGDNSDLNFVIGSPQISTALSSRWRNSWVFSVYTAIGLTDDLTLRLGLNHGNSPFNEDLQGVAPNTGIAETNLAIGLGWRIGPLDLSVLVEHGFHSQDRTGRFVEPLSAQNTYWSARQWFIHFGMGYWF